MRRLCFLIFFLAPGNGPKSMGSAEGNLAIGDLGVESCELFFFIGSYKTRMSFIRL